MFLKQLAHRVRSLANPEEICALAWQFRSDLSLCALVENVGRGLTFSSRCALDVLIICSKELSINSLSLK